MPGCCAFGCCNRHEAGKQLFRIPDGERNRTRRLFWLTRISRKGFTPPSCTRLCEEHFAEDPFFGRRNDGKRKLARDAVPSIFAHKPKKPPQRAPLSRGTEKKHMERKFALQKPGIPCSIPTTSCFDLDEHRTDTLSCITTA
ncbi:hypothetical protein HPB47_024892 [Ixodes persulcatus]|uniref:Uncharacterized protein n=1 Tax=Ixodes persulcatus TaxID=34615 RepID=A0AC60Q3M3_IXOPE|nr:hypothetical protein HPB47_024892 [Ixodes persulcatus]